MTAEGSWLGKRRWSGLTPWVVRGSSRSMWEPIWPGWLDAASALREADMVVDVYNARVDMRFGFWLTIMVWCCLVVTVCTF